MIPVAFDLRDPVRSGIARVARSLARAFVHQSNGRFKVTLAGPRAALHEIGAHEWGRQNGPDNQRPRIVDWDADRYSARAEVAWGGVRRDVGDASWYFPHWDVPWHALPKTFVVTIHDLGHLRLPNVSVARRALARRWIRRAASHAGRITAVTRFTQRELLAKWPDLKDKIEVVPNGIDERFFAAPQPLPQAIASLLPAGPFMLSVGNLKTHKNLIAGPDVLASVPGLHWVLVGEEFPDWHAVDERAQQLGVASRMRVLGQQSDDILHALYHRAGCLFFPSRHEGFGLPILEALACGTPVVAGDAEGSAETLGSAGWLCNLDEPADFAAAVCAAIETGRHADRVARGIARAREFTWEASAARLASIFENLNARS